jgi:hypothetical protein
MAHKKEPVVVSAWELGKKIRTLENHKGAAPANYVPELHVFHAKPISTMDSVVLVFRH